MPSRSLDMDSVRVGVGLGQHHQPRNKHALRCDSRPALVVTLSLTKVRTLNPTLVSYPPNPTPHPSIDVSSILALCTIAPPLANQVKILRALISAVAAAIGCLEGSADAHEVQEGVATLPLPASLRVGPRTSPWPAYFTLALLHPGLRPTSSLFAPGLRARS